MNKGLLYSEVVARNDTFAGLAKKIGLSPQRLSAKVNGRHGAGFTIAEAAAIARLYGLTAKGVWHIFFV